MKATQKYLSVVLFITLYKVNQAYVCEKIYIYNVIIQIKEGMRVVSDVSVYTFSLLL